MANRKAGPITFKELSTACAKFGVALTELDEHSVMGDWDDGYTRRIPIKWLKDAVLNQTVSMLLDGARRGTL